jgi:H+/Na+-translocating ferredoxin:NAD+ oxidoreductase subunit D
MTTRFELAPAPHARAFVGVPLVMRRVLYALAPAAICYVWFFGWGLAVNFVVAAGAALATEAIMLRLRGRGTRQALRDGSALVTAALLSFALPPLVPAWIPALGAIVAVMVAKQLFGGLGKNLFNPAMVGYVFLLISFPVEMTQWIPPRMGDIDYHHLTFFGQLNYAFLGHLPSGLDIDTLTRATPLDIVKEGLRAGHTFGELRGGSLFGDFGGRGWEWVGNLIALGGLYLLYTGTIRWQIPVALFAGLLTPAVVFYFIDTSQYAAPGFHAFSGASMLGAFFIATDPVSAATTDRGRLVYGAGIGLLTYLIRTWGGYPDGIAFAVLLMNGAVPLIDRYTRPRIYGRR